jgi:hypothetical protein
MTKLLFEPGTCYDIIIDFNGHNEKHIIMGNGGGDSPYRGGSTEGNFLSLKMNSTSSGLIKSWHLM